MSKIYDKRQALAADIIAANIGWTADNIVYKRQTDLWNVVATAVAAQNSTGSVLVIGAASGDAGEGDELDMQCTMVLTILCLPQVADDATPEEDLWEALVLHVHDLRLGNDHFTYRFKFKSWTDADVEADGGTAYLARQTTFDFKLSL